MFAKFGKSERDKARQDMMDDDSFVNVRSKYTRPGDARWCYSCQREAEIMRTGIFVTSLCTMCGMGRNHFATDEWQVNLESFNANSKEGHGNELNIQRLHGEMLSRMVPTPADIISSYVQVNADVAEESITEREDVVIEVPQEDTLNDTERRRNSQRNSMTRPCSSDDDADTTYGVNLWGDAMEHMREISEFARGVNPDEVGAMNLDSDSIKEERRLAEELADELERQRLTMQYHREVPGFQSWFNRFEIDTEFEHLWDSKECEDLCGDSNMSISDTSGYNTDEDRVRDMA
eukprot:scaffold553_cov70-Cyclotella_meneghiniana.AAC.4